MKTFLYNRYKIHYLEWGIPIHENSGVVDKVIDKKMMIFYKKVQGLSLGKRFLEPTDHIDRVVGFNVDLVERMIRWRVGEDSDRVIR